MTTIDADAHVIENDQTWSYLNGDEVRYRPNKLRHVDEAHRQPMRDDLSSEWWIFDKNIQRADTNVNKKETPRESRELTSV